MLSGDLMIETLLQGAGLAPVGLAGLLPANPEYILQVKRK